MSFGKYHEDNMGLWKEKTRDKSRPSINVAYTQLKKIESRKNACISKNDSINRTKLEKESDEFRKWLYWWKQNSIGCIPPTIRV